MTADERTLIWRMKSAAARIAYHLEREGVGRVARVPGRPDTLLRLIDELTEAYSQLRAIEIGRTSIPEDLPDWLWETEGWGTTVNPHDDDGPLGGYPGAA